MSANTFVKIAGVLLSVVTVAALGILGLRAAFELHLGWDTFHYHLPFAASRAGIAHTFIPSPHHQNYFGGFPPLPHFIQGILWRITGTANAINTINFLAFVLFLGYAHRRLKAPFWIVGPIALTAPMVIIHTTVAYNDLFNNVWLAIGITTFAHLVIFKPDRPTWHYIWGTVGLILACWSKYQMVPVAAVFLMAYPIYFGVQHRHLPYRDLLKKLGLFGVCILIAATPYIKNIVRFQNPFWPVKPPILSDYIPSAMDLSDPSLGQYPPPLKGVSQFELFFRSLFEVGHPKSYPHRYRWTYDQGRAWDAFRSGGFWNISVVSFLVLLTLLGFMRGAKTGGMVLGGWLGLLVVIALLPQSHELRYYMALPLSWAVVIGMLARPLIQKHPDRVCALSAVVLALFVTMVIENKHYYTITKRTLSDAAQLWGASPWWPFLNETDTFCILPDMAPKGFLMTGPTHTEFKIVEAPSKEDCPVGSRVITKGLLWPGKVGDVTGQ